MSKLTEDQRRFLRHQGISLSLVFDGSGLSKADRTSMMDELDKKFYYGGSPCAAAGHTLRSKAGHCIQCDTSKIAFQLRSSQSGYLYLAYSSRRQCAKVGITSVGPRERVAVLASSGYGNCVDWKLIESVYLESKAGATEFQIHASLEPFQTGILYEKQPGIEVECREVFFCDIDLALSAFRDAVSN